jgi:hypothetical protein
MKGVHSPAIVPQDKALSSTKHVRVPMSQPIPPTLIQAMRKRALYVRIHVPQRQHHVSADLQALLQRAGILRPEEQSAPLHQRLAPQRTKPGRERGGDLVVHTAAEHTIGDQSPYLVGYPSCAA